MTHAEPYATDTSTAGVIARPPLLFLAAFLLGIALDRLLALPFPLSATGPGLEILTGAAIVIGVAVTAAGIRNLVRARTPVPTNRPTHALVTTGIHGWSRNPIYFGFFLVYGGLGVAMRKPSVLVMALPVALAIRYGVVAREEAYLERRFGVAYREYCARVRRWI